jgi:hypothetical protein
MTARATPIPVTPLNESATADSRTPATPIAETPIPDVEFDPLSAPATPIAEACTGVAFPETELGGDPVSGRIPRGATPRIDIGYADIDVLY